MYIPHPPLEDDVEAVLENIVIDPGFILRLLENVRNSVTIDIAGGVQLEFRGTAKLDAYPVLPLHHIRLVDTEQSNSTVLIDSSYVVKLYRKLQGGVNPEIEVGRFLTDVAGYGNTAPLLGSVELVDDEWRSAVAVVLAFFTNQGNAWTMTASCFDRFLEDQLLRGETGEEQAVSYLRCMSEIGRCVAEMHISLASRDDVADFKPEPLEPKDSKVWIDGAVARAEQSLEKLQRQRGRAKGFEKALVDRVLAVREGLRKHLLALLPESVDAVKIRHHGDLHLGQLLVIEGNVFIVDFEGEPCRAMSERRRKAPGVRNIADLVRSIDYSTTAELERAPKVAPKKICGALAAVLDLWREHATGGIHRCISRCRRGNEAAAHRFQSCGKDTAILYSGEGVV